MCPAYYTVHWRQGSVGMGTYEKRLRYGAADMKMGAISAVAPF